MASLKEHGIKSEFDLGRRITGACPEGVGKSVTEGLRVLADQASLFLVGGELFSGLGYNTGSDTSQGVRPKHDFDLISCGVQLETMADQLTAATKLEWLVRPAASTGLPIARAEVPGKLKITIASGDSFLYYREPQCTTNYDASRGEIKALGGNDLICTQTGNFWEVMGDPGAVRLLDYKYLAEVDRQHPGLAQIVVARAVRITQMYQLPNEDTKTIGLDGTDFEAAKYFLTISMQLETLYAQENRLAIPSPRCHIWLKY